MKLPGMKQLLLNCALPALLPLTQAIASGAGIGSLSPNPSTTQPRGVIADSHVVIEATPKDLSARHLDDNVPVRLPAMGPAPFQVRNFTLRDLGGSGGKRIEAVLVTPASTATCSASIAPGLPFTGDDMHPCTNGDSFAYPRHGHVLIFGTTTGIRDGQTGDA